jgi:hypothetical protein
MPDKTSDRTKYQKLEISRSKGAHGWNVIVKDAGIITRRDCIISGLQIENMNANCTLHLSRLSTGRVSSLDAMLPSSLSRPESIGARMHGYSDPVGQLVSLFV